MGLTPFELADAMLPELAPHAIKIGKRTIEVVVGDDRKAALRENGAVLAKPPKELTAKHKEEVKAFGTEIKEAARQLRASLEYYLIIQRRWKAADWKAFFLGNPLARAFAKDLLWASYDGKTRSKLFRGDNTAAPTGTVGLVHPLDVSAEERATWLEQLPEQPFPQLARAVFSVAPDERPKKLSFRYEGKSLNAGTFKSRAERLGWRRGSVNDGGSISAYRKVYPTDQIEVFLRLEGIGVGMDFEAEVTLEDLMFVKAGSVVVGSYTYDEPRDEDDPRLIAFGALPRIVFSETIGDVNAILKTKAEDD